MSRNTGGSTNTNRIKKLQLEEVNERFTDPEIALAIKSNLVVMPTLDDQIEILESAVKKKARLEPEYKYRLSTPGIGTILGLAILLETGDIQRFPKAGNYAS